ncbi:MAG: asparagine synthetase B (glutamine-hydrolyzing) [Gammaproteobacteria bacterium]
MAASALHIFKKNAYDERNLELFSLVFPGQACDESNYIKAFYDFYSTVTSHRFPPSPRAHEWYSSYVSLHQDIPPYPNGSMSLDLYKHAQQRSIARLLTGLGGDEWFQASRFYIADLLSNGRLLELRNFLRSYQNVPSDSLFTQQIITHGIAPLLPESVKSIIGISRGGKQPTPPNWMGPELLDLAQQELLQTMVTAGPVRGYAAQHLWKAATSGFQTHAMEMEERLAAGFGIELGHPFYDQRVIQASLALPMNQRIRKNLNKYALRQAMSDYLPALIYKRPDKAEFSSVFLNALKAVGRENFEPQVAHSFGWVNKQLAIELFDQTMCDLDNRVPVNGANLWSLWHIYGLELVSSKVFSS